MKKVFLLFVAVTMLFIVAACNGETETYTLEFVDYDGTVIQTEDFEGGADLSSVDAPADPTREGYTFDGWDIDVPAVMTETTITITATYTINSYTLEFVDHDGTVLQTEDFDFEESLSGVTAPADPSRAGYTFDGWDLSIPTSMPANDVTITATYEAVVLEDYTLAFVDHDGTVLQTADYEEGSSLSSVTAPADPTRVGYTFDSWDMTIPATMPSNDLTITATYVINQYTITFDSDGGSAVGAITLDYGSAIPAVADPEKVGYSFTGWDMTIPSTMPAEDMTITATYTINQYTITFEENDGSAVDDLDVDYMASIVLPADPTRDGYTFGGWYTDDLLTMPFEEATMPAEDIMLYAKWNDLASLFEGDDVYRFEAEDAEISGTPSYGDAWVETVEGASAGMSVGYLGVADNAMTFEINASAATTASLALYMSSSSMNWTTYIVGDQLLTTANFQVEVNGAIVEYDDTTILGSNEVFVFNTVWTPLYVMNIDLVEGANTIKFTILSADAGPNTDYLDIYSPDAELTWADGGGSAGVNYEGASSYDLIVEGFEWGPSVTRMVVNFPDDVIDAANLDMNLFEVLAGSTQRTILAAYLSDAYGEPVVETTSHYVTFDLEIGYDTSGWGGAIDNSTAFTYDFGSGRNTFRDLAIYSIRLADSQVFTINGSDYDGFAIAATAYNGYQVPQTADLIKDTFTEADVTLTYAAYETQAMVDDTVLNPLIIWLHGAGEGGTDVDIALLGNEATALMTDPIQGYFRDGTSEGAYVLVVQTPTMWMDDGTGAYTSGALPSMYEAALFATIEAYVASNSDIDTNRIYLGGCSNGGYMTVNMLIEHPNYFAAAYPVCEAYSDSEIDATELATLASVPIWFVASADDTTVAPTDYAVATYTRLVQAGADVHFSYFSTVVGVDEPGATYMGHWSWIYVFNNEVSLDQDYAAVDVNGASSVIAPSTEPVVVETVTVNLWQWLALQVLPAE